MKLIYNLFFLSCLLFSNIIPSYSQNMNEYNLDSVIVSAGYNSFSSFLIERNVIEISKDEINKKPIMFLNEVFENYSGIDLRKRGYLQADISIRGSTYDQTLILFDGIPLIDNQTGHHSLDLPISINDIEKIEILKGSGSRIFGANAVGGVVNIIPSFQNNNTSEIKGSISNNRTFNGSFFSNQKFGRVTQYLGLSAARSDGYRYNTDFQNYSFLYRFHIPIDSTKFFFTAGFSDKKFGANGFYSILYPDQWEHTKSTLLIFGLNKNNFDVKLFWKNHSDEYLLFRNNPEKYRNNHLKDNFGLISRYSFLFNNAFYSFGIETGYEQIESNNLKNHNRKRFNIFFDYNSEIISNLVLSIGSVIHFSSEWNPNFSPGFDLSYKLSENFLTFFATNSSFRIPNYTELYYKSPINQGNPNLIPEKAVNYEIGFNYYKNYFKVLFSLFRREGNHLIDWVKSNNSNIWQTENITEINYNGFEINLIYDNIPRNLLGLEKISLSYNYISAHKLFNQFESKYILDHLNHQFLLSISHTICNIIENNLFLKYEERNKGEKYFLFDLKILKDLSIGNISFSIMNLFNKYYTEIGDIPMPGRTFNFCFSIRF